MSTLKSNPQLDRQLSQAQDPESLRQLLHNHFESTGVIQRERGAQYHAAPQTPASVAAAPALPSRENFSATVSKVIYPYGNLRLEISGVDAESLDAVEERIKQAFEQQ
jgi:hypothetical protein